MKFSILLAIVCLFLVSEMGLSSCSRQKCPAQSGGYVTPPPKVGRHHKPQSGLWPKGMK